MNAVDTLYEEIDDGKEGRNIGISMGLPDLDKILYGIQKKHLYTIGADTAGGKTSFGLDVFVYNAIKNSGDRPVHILYYSFEMSESSLLAKVLSRYVFEEYGEVVTYEDILSLTKKISDKKLKLVKEAREWLQSVSDRIKVYDKQLSPPAIYATLKRWLEGHGEFVPLNQYEEEYFENDRNAYKIVLIDHMGLISGEGTKKERIDKVVDYLIYFREKCNITGVMIQQLNRNAKAMDRKLNGYELVQLDDFQDTSGTVQGSNIVIALFYPYREKVARCEGYPIQNVLKHNFRLIQVLKSRFGKADISKGAVFYGEISMFMELPRPEEINDYEPYLTLKPMQEIKILEDDEQEDDNNLIFKF